MEFKTAYRFSGSICSGLVLLFGMAAGPLMAQVALDEPCNGATAPPAFDSDFDPAATQGICHFYDDDSTIDVLVIYTERARLNNANGDIDAYIDEHIGIMNDTLRRSEALPRMEVIHSEKVDYDEGACTCNYPPSGINNDVTIDRLLDPNDGYLDEVFALRNSYHADLVLMYTGCVNCGGVAACNHGDQFILEESGGFAVVDGVLPFPWGTAHELGHVMGCGHNRAAENDGPGRPRNCRAYPYSYGYDYIGDSGQWHSTVLSYGPTFCGGIEDGIPCTMYYHNSDCPFPQECKHVTPQKILYYSNPDVSYDGKPTGVAVDEPEAANCALTLNQTAFIVANYRQRPGNKWVDFANTGTELGCFEFPFSTVQRGLDNVPDQGTLIFKAGGTTVTTGEISERMTLKAYGGPVRIGAP